MGRLTATFCRTAPDGRHGDGAGLYLWVRGGSKLWIYRFQLNGKRRDLSLGPYPLVTLAEAREAAYQARRLVKVEKLDPVLSRRRSRSLRFAEAAQKCIRAKAPGWSNAKHAEQWASTLQAYAFPVLGALDVAEVATDEVVAALKPIWSDKPETASRVRQRIEAVLDFAKAAGYREGENPARWRGHLDQLLPAVSKRKRVKHHAALPYAEAPRFWADLAKRKGISAAALRWTILTGCRTGETLGARWGEIADGVWTVLTAQDEDLHRAPGTAISRRPGAAGRAEAPRCTRCSLEPRASSCPIWPCCRCCGSSGRPDCPRVSIDVQGLDRRADRCAPPCGRAGPRACHSRRGGAGISPRGFIGQARRADGAVGCVFIQRGKTLIKDQPTGNSFYVNRLRRTLESLQRLRCA